MRRSTPLILCFLCLTLLAGCGPRSTAVSGNVTIDGVPVDAGTISFVAADGKGSPAIAEIKGGRYATTMSSGTKKVQISAPGPTRKVPSSPAPNAPLMDVQGDERLPAKYHSSTTLEYEAKGGSDTKDWATTTK